MPFTKLNGKQEQVLLYLYEFRNASERGVPPDPRVTLQGLATGTGLSINDVINEVDYLKSKAMVRSVKIGSKYYLHLTLKSENELSKIERKIVKLGFNNLSFNGQYERSERKGGER